MVEEFRIGNACLYLGDTEAIIKNIPFIDACVTDPPYGIGEANKNFASRGKLANADKYKQSDWDDEPAKSWVINEICRISKHQIIFGGNYFHLPPSKCWLVWDKQNGTNDFADCELAWTNLNKAVRKIEWRWNGMIRKGQEKRYHPTQKPLGVMSWCISHLPDDVETILDPYMGSGTTGVAAIKAGKKFIGIEADKEYFDIACKRIEEAYSQPDIFLNPEQFEPVPEPENGCLFL